MTIHTTPCIGLIPACAGKTHSPLTTSYMLTAHPRVCGENLMILVRIGRKAGSSPRVRGKRTLTPTTVQAPGLIPACAGKTACIECVGYGARAHPRVCGENSGGRPSRARTSGSSPRVRGKPAYRRQVRGHARLIPACAGKTSYYRRTRRRTEAHPRVCGENEGTWEGKISGEGSSPRVRGKHVMCVPSPSSRGLIPACAGKTW